MRALCDELIGQQCLQGKPDFECTERVCRHDYLSQVMLALTTHLLALHLFQVLS